mgnify:CR=1 FL=1
MKKIIVLSFLFSGLLLFSCQNESSKNNTDKEEFQDFEGLLELILDGYYQPCNSDEKIKVVDRSQNAFNEIKELGLPRMQPCFAKFKGYEKTNDEGEKFIELHQLYKAVRKIPDDCINEPLPFGVLAADDNEYRMQINPFDNVIKFQDNFSDGILDFPYYPPEKVGDQYIFNTSIRTKDYETNLKVIVEQKDCTKEGRPDAYYSLTLKIQIDDRVYNSCGTKV